MKFLLCLLVLLISACHTNEKKFQNEAKIDNVDGISKDENLNTTDTPYLKIIGDSVELPPFIIDLDLSKRAEDTLRSQNESIIIAALFSVVSKIDREDREEKEDPYNKLGVQILCKKDIELFKSRTVEFKNVKFSKKLYTKLIEKDINVLIEVISGRRASKFNILDCNYIDTNFNKVKNSRITIKGKLIVESI